MSDTISLNRNLRPETTMSFTHDWFSSCIPTWEQHLGHLAGRPLHALEIGCFEGRSTRWLLENILTHDEARITVCDTFAGSMEHHDGSYTVGPLTIEQVFDEEVLGLFPGKVIKRKGRSIDTLASLQGDPPAAAYDLIYVDGSHVAKDVMADGLLSWNLLKPEGILIFDDYGWNHYPDPALTPRLAIDTFLIMFASELQVLRKGYQVIVQRNPPGVVTEPPAAPVPAPEAPKGWWRKITARARRTKS